MGAATTVLVVALGAGSGCLVGSVSMIGASVFPTLELKSSVLVGTGSALPDKAVGSTGCASSGSGVRFDGSSGAVVVSSLRSFALITCVSTSSDSFDKSESCATDSFSVVTCSSSVTSCCISGVSEGVSVASSSTVLTVGSFGRSSDGDDTGCDEAGVEDAGVEDAGGVRVGSSRVGSGTMLGIELFEEGSVLIVFVTVSTRTGISIPDFA